MTNFVIFIALSFLMVGVVWNTFCLTPNRIGEIANSVLRFTGTENCSDKGFKIQVAVAIVASGVRVVSFIFLISFVIGFAITLITTIF